MKDGGLEASIIRKPSLRQSRLWRGHFSSYRRLLAGSSASTLQLNRSYEEVFDRSGGGCLSDMMNLLGMALLIVAAMIKVTDSDVLSGFPYVTGSVSESASTAVLPKTVFSSQLRLVFTVGIEGTGHNYFCEVFDNFFDNNPNIPRLLREDNLNAGRFNIGSSMGSNAHHYGTAITAARKAMRKLAQHGAELPSPGAVNFVQLKYSYPVGVGANKALKYLDLRLLAEVAEAEGVDFRVVYLQRPAKDMLVANTVHRKFPK